MKNLTIFSISFITCLVALYFERMIGIGWNYHPDVVTYLNEYGSRVAEGNVINNLYYYVAYFSAGNLFTLIMINVIFYSVTNILMVNSYAENLQHLKFSRFKILILFLVIALTPYRIHLAIHALKDTLIIFLLLLFTLNSGLGRRFLLIIPMVLFRVASIIYFILFLRWRIIIFGFILIMLISFLMDMGVIDFLVSRSNAGMHSRDFDNITTFSEFGFLGSVMRMFLWPLLLITGSFSLFSPVPVFLFLTLEMVAGKIWWYLVGINLESIFMMLVTLAIIAGGVDSFTSYIRYAYPILVVVPFLKSKRKNNRIASEASLQ